MELYSSNENYKLYHGNMLDMLEAIEPNSIDSIVTDPPYGLTSITKRFGKEDSVECQYGKDGSFQRLSRGFMGKEWDGSGIEYNIETWQKCYEVLKDGGYLLAFGGSRTFHRIACAIEDAGFEIRDTIMWLYGSGFPKSMDISKSLDKRNGRTNNDFLEFGKYLKEKRGNISQTEISKYFPSKNGGITGRVSNWENGLELPNKDQYTKLKNILDLDDKYDYLIEKEQAKREIIGKGKSGLTKGTISNFAGTTEFDITTPSTDLAKQWQGWGTALKPSFEPIIVARKPFKGSLVDNVIEYGVGGINIDECRVGNEEISYFPTNLEEAHGNKFGNGAYMPKDTSKPPITHTGRFPANTILTYDETDFDEVCGGFPDTKGDNRKSKPTYNKSIWGNAKSVESSCLYNDSGSASRYFMNCKYTGKDEEIWKQLLANNVGSNLEILKATKDNIAQMNVEDLQKRYIYTPKASKKDRDEGLDTFIEEKVNDGRQTPIDNAFQRRETLRRNVHPCVKPANLMQYLVRLVTPNGGTILDPFNGSGSTGKAVMYENKERNKNYKYIGIELTEEYLPIAKARIEYVCNLKEDKLKDMQMSIFDLGDSNE